MSLIHLRLTYDEWKDRQPFITHFLNIYFSFLLAETWDWRLTCKFVFLPLSISFRWIEMNGIAICEKCWDSWKLLVKFYVFWWIWIEWSGLMGWFGICENLSFIKFTRFWIKWTIVWFFTPFRKPLNFDVIFAQLSWKLAHSGSA